MYIATNPVLGGRMWRCVGKGIRWMKGGQVKMNIISHARNTVDCVPTMAYFMLLT